MRTDAFRLGRSTLPDRAATSVAPTSSSPPPPGSPPPAMLPPSALGRTPPAPTPAPPPAPPRTLREPTASARALVSPDRVLPQPRSSPVQSAGVAQPSAGAPPPPPHVPTSAACSIPNHSSTAARCPPGRQDPSQRAHVWETFFRHQPQRLRAQATRIPTGLSPA